MRDFTLGEFLCRLDALAYREAINRLEERMRSLTSNPFIDKPQLELKKLQIEFRELNLNYANLEPL